MGVEFPVSPDGRRSTSALGRSVVADALRPVDPEGAAAAEHERDWRRGYLRHFRRLIEAGLPSPDAALDVAREGLSSLYRQMRLVAADQSELGLEHVIKASPAGPAPATVTVTGEAAPERELVIPYRDQQLRGDSLLRQLDDWVGRGIIEPSCAEAIRAVAAHPEWLALPGQTVVVLGAGAEVGPLSVLLSWGVTAIGVDLPSAPLWSRVLETARRKRGHAESPGRRVARGRGSRFTSPGSRRWTWLRAPASTWPPTSRWSPTGWPPSTARWSWATTSTPTAPPTSAWPARSTR